MAKAGVTMAKKKGGWNLEKIKITMGHGERHFKKQLVHSTGLQT